MKKNWKKPAPTYYSSPRRSKSGRIKRPVDRWTARRQIMQQRARLRWHQLMHPFKARKLRGAKGVRQ